MQLNQNADKLLLWTVVELFMVLNEHIQVESLDNTLKATSIA